MTLPELAALWLALVNLVCFIVFRNDKRAAIAGRRRVPERVFYAMAALGAVPAILIGAKFIRHKTRKQPFRAIVFVIFALQAASVIAWLSLG
ncbi:cold shock protein [Stappia sp. 22II-S9-Z10]|nr:cold shock protein [Stappia sp. 22II-S9-Z10]